MLQPLDISDSPTVSTHAPAPEAPVATVLLDGAVSLAVLVWITAESASR